MAPDDTFFKSSIPKPLKKRFEMFCERFKGIIFLENPIFQIKL
jgi:hypothetical protein